MMKSTRARGTRAWRREGVALVVVVALLGILFVVGVVFLKSMRFEAQSLQIQQERVDRDTAIGSVVSRVGEALISDVIGDGGVAYASKQTDGLLRGNGEVIQPTYGEVLGVHSLLGQPEATAADVNALWQGGRGSVLASDMEAFVSREPFQAPAALPTNEQFWPGKVDVRIPLTAPKFVDSNDGVIDNSDWIWDWEDANGNPVQLWGDYNYRGNDVWTPDGMVDWVDSDGDGINDARQFRLSSLGIADEQVRELKRLVNDPINAAGEPGVGMTVVDHGAMVNLSSAHPLLINTLLADDYKVRPTVDRAGMLSREYSSAVEEPPLRRRGGLVPSRVLPPTKLTGNPFIPDIDYGTDPGELGDKLLLPLPLLAQGQHHWWSMTFDEPYDQGGDVWLHNVLSTRQTSTGVGNGMFYDRRRWVTTVSHDDLFSRYVQGQGGRDLTDVMRRRYIQNESSADPKVRSSLPFLAYYQYPCVDVDGNGVADVSSCPDFDGDGAMEANLGGRLLMSLPWVEKELLGAFAKPDVPTGVNAIDYLQQQLAVGGAVDPADAAKAGAAVAQIQATFTRMLLNYAMEDPLPPFFDDGEFTGVPSPAFGGRDLDDFDYDGGGTADRFDLVAYLAASMTANLIDFADQGWDAAHLVKDTDGRTRPGYEDLLYDDPSTSVPLRVSNPGSAQFGQVIEAVDAQGGGLGIPESAHGLERQPYITEVTAVFVERNGGTDPCAKAYAVELFSPYRDAVFDLSRYGLYVVSGQSFENGKLYRFDSGGPAFLPNPQTMAGVPVEARPDGYFGVAWGDEQGGPNGSILWNTEKCQRPPYAHYETKDFSDQWLEFENGDTIYLVRFNAGYDGAFHAVDAFEVNGANIATKVTIPDCTEDWEPHAYTMERRMRRASDDQIDPYYWALDPTERPGAKHRWMASIGEAPDGDFNAFDGAGKCQHSLGFENGKNTDDDSVAVGMANLTAIRDVEVEFADTGSLEAAYPTTASMLYMMRYANLRDGAFTRMLAGEKGQIDNGRLPVFDNGVEGVDLQGNPITLAPHHADPAGSNEEQPGGLKQLPWGQTVFDYFTALPLETVVDPEYEKPVVDEGGFRVNGRINLNSAPWSVMSGLPVSQMSAMPLPYLFDPYDSGVDSDGDGRNEVRWVLKPAVHNALRYALLTDGELRNDMQLDAYTTYPVGYRLAKAIAGYREATAAQEWTDIDGDGVDDSLETSGNYGAPGAHAGGRTWTGQGPAEGPQHRRGTGLMTVGELANVRNVAASPRLGSAYTGFRFDLGVNGRQLPVNGYTFVQENYGEAVALLAAMSDWTTTRSHVFTLYGTIRGNADFDGGGYIDPAEAARLGELDKRAIRFEETLDRFPSLLGKSKPASVGQRVVGSYSDAYSD
ncbi:MAG: hypothetical protein IT449_07065 [Phycisphaerales bacterium]|nr:hypothetical protein [Phycisphaerales bacterium]